MTDIRQAAIDLRAAADRLLAQLGSASGSDQGHVAAPLPLVRTYATIAQYAAHRGVSTSTIKRWLRYGLPVERAGRVVRVRVADADAWVARGGASRVVQDLAKGAA